MELWIRSQDKHRLIKANNIILNGNGFIYCDELYIGSYEEERALEILDEIQMKLINKFIIQPCVLAKTSDLDRVEKELNDKYVGDFIMEPPAMDIKPINQNVVIYEMPEE